MITISEIIARERESIIARWREQAGRAASARGLDEPALTNIMPRFLQSLGTGEDVTEYVERHFATRLRQGFQLAEILDEFALLGRCIVERSLAIPAEVRPDLGEIDRLYTTLQRASTAVVAMFDEHMRQDEQLEKRYMRLLRDVATAVLHAGMPALKTRLQELLEVLREAMDAHGVAIVIRSEDNHEVSVATAGAGMLEEYATSVGAVALAAQAATKEPPSLWEVTATTLDVTGELRRAGIRTLLGVELTSRSGLLGAIYVGTSEDRTFSPSERRRLESLSEQLLAHLDTITLLERRTATIARLHTERSIREHFVSALAHDLRGPLSAAKLGAQLLSHEPTTIDVRRDLAVRIDRNLDRLDRMIRDLLDASLVRAGERLPLRLDWCDLGQITHEVAEELRVLHGDRFVVEADDRALGFWSDDELRRALWNLGTNAVKYGAPDRPITFRSMRIDGRARLSVHNWGAPISPEDQGRIFAPFARSSRGIDNGRAGWGLGLTLVRGCAEAHGGGVGLTSSESEGTTFTIEIPLDARPYQTPLAAPIDGAPSTSVH